MEEKKNKLIVILIGIIILLIGVILFVVLNKQEENKNEKKEENKIEKVENKETEDNKVVENRKYNNFQQSEIDFTIYKDDIDVFNETIKFYIENKNLKASTETKQITITGITGNIESFIGANQCGELVILAINENKEVFYTIIKDDDNNLINHKIVFNKLNTNENITDITEHTNLSYSHGSCIPANLSVVLKNGEIRSFEYDKNKKVTIGKEDYSMYLENLNGDILIINDGSIMLTSTEEKIRYKNEALKADKIYLVKDEPIADESKYLELEYYKVHYYIISNDNLYKLTIDYNDMMQNGEKLKYNIVLVSDKKVIKTTITNKGLTEDENYDQIKETFTFEDNTTKVINADSIYVIK